MDFDREGTPGMKRKRGGVRPDGFGDQNRDEDGEEHHALSADEQDEPFPKYYSIANDADQDGGDVNRHAAPIEGGVENERQVELEHQMPARRTFDTSKDYEEHYRRYHTYVCQECKFSFPSEFWLSLHISELHDMIFRYRCFEESCEKQFLNPKKRRLHMIDKHKYPKGFNWRMVVTGHADPSTTVPKNRQRHTSTTTTTTPTSSHHYHSDQGEVLPLPDEPSDRMDDDAAYSELPNELERRAQITVPPKILFGRR
ncbi:hypothetical protein EV182_002755 [Spiromyces aspiralis]|uniref:Uncharacterized protein n=1 Tax=Spiromyces aspiralis TaxID=68401 RepID=A0ACC1HLA6_9FUNG|nr:hypothetical protein EV182_002755 [Spiromyces aspiralis]